MQQLVKVRRWVLAGALAVSCSAAWAQSPDLASTLRNLAQSSADYRKSMPSFTCVENVVSTEKHKGKVKVRVEFRANIRVTRGPDGSLQETFSTTEYMGTPVSGNPVLPAPLYMQGGLSRGAPIYFAADQQRCYHYSLHAGRVDFKADPIDAACDSPPSTRGFVSLDNEGNPVHTETRRSLGDSIRHNMATFSAVDYSAIELNGKTYRLPTHLYSELADRGEARTFDASYTGCRLFQATVTIHDPNVIDPQ